MFINNFIWRGTFVQLDIMCKNKKLLISGRDKLDMKIASLPKKLGGLGSFDLMLKTAKCALANIIFWSLSQHGIAKEAGNLLFRPSANVNKNNHCLGISNGRSSQKLPLKQKAFDTVWLYGERILTYLQAKRMETSYSNITRSKKINFTWYARIEMVINKKAIHWRIPFFYEQQWRQYINEIEKTLPAGMMHFLEYQAFRQNVSIHSRNNSSHYQKAHFSGWEAITVQDGFTWETQGIMHGSLALTKCTQSFFFQTNRRKKQLQVLCKELLCNGFFLPHNQIHSSSYI